MKFNQRSLMELAVKTMQASIAEKREDGKVSPAVGAVLWHPDGRIDTACRGELRFGDHAEFGLLERKNRDQALDGCVLFATLEPCAPGSRNHPKLGCAERIVLARISEVYVGIEDPDPLVDRKGIRFLEDNGINVHLFDRDLQQQIRDFNSAFLKQAHERAEESLAPEPIVLSSLEGVAVESAFDDFSLEALSEYRQLAEIDESLDSDDFKRRLVRQGALCRDKEQSLTPTGFGILLFGEEPRVSFPQAGLLAKALLPSGDYESRSFEGPLVLIPTEVEAWVKKVMPIAIDRSEMVRKDEPLFPFKLIREGVINALVHRDYDIKEAKVQLEVSQNEIVIRSPGSPVSPLTLEQLRSFDAPNLSRNPVLHLIFSQMKMAEERGFGMQTWKSIPFEYGLVSPTYGFETPYLELVLSREPLPEKLIQACNWITDLGREFTTSEYEKAFEVSDRSARRAVQELKKLGILVSGKRGNDTFYWRRDRAPQGASRS